jgi:hypothetical protein
MSDSVLELPEVEARDPEAVAVAIETARALFRSGDRTEALRWLRRAAERAEEAGDDLRAFKIASSAADLSTALQSAPPPSQADEAVALAPYDDFSEQTLVDAKGAVRDPVPPVVRIREVASQDAPDESVTVPSPPSAPSFVPRTTLKAQPESVAPAARSALRVSAARDAANPEAWIVRLLPEGTPPPAGSEEALLIALDPYSTLLQ